MLETEAGGGLVDRSRYRLGYDSGLDEFVTLRELADLAPTTARCLFCSWSFHGTAAEARAAWQKHEMEHR